MDNEKEIREDMVVMRHVLNELSKLVNFCDNRLNYCAVTNREQGADRLSVLITHIQELREVCRLMCRGQKRKAPVSIVNR